MQTSQSPDPDAPRPASAVRRGPGAAVLLVAALALAVVPATAQQPHEAEAQERPDDPFAGPSIFDHSPDRGVSVSRLTLEAADAPPLVSVSDFYRVSFLARWSRLQPRGRTAGVLRANPLELEIPPTVRENDRVVLWLDGLDAEAGDVLQAVRRGRELADGRAVVHSVAMVEVLGVRGDSARARVRRVFADYRVGDPVIAAAPFAARGVRDLRPADRALTTTVVSLEIPQALVGTNDRVFLDAGSEAGLGSGDELMVFPEGTDDPAAAEPADRLGVVRVVRARDGSSTARVVETRDVGIRDGAPAVLVRRAQSGER